MFKYLITLFTTTFITDNFEISEEDIATIYHHLLSTESFCKWMT